MPWLRAARSNPFRPSAKLTSACADVHSAASANRLIRRHRTGKDAKDKTKDTAMGLFRKDLYHSFLIGFLIGTAGLAASIGGEARAEIVAQVLPGA